MESKLDSKPQSEPQSPSSKSNYSSSKSTTPPSSSKSLSDPENRPISPMITPITVKSIEIDNSQAPLSDPFDLDITFHLPNPIPSLSISVEYMVDGMLGRHVVPLTTTPREHYDQGLNNAFVQIEKVHIGGIKPGRLANAGLLCIKFLEHNIVPDGKDAPDDDQGVEVCQLNCVVMVTESNGSFERVIYSPFE
mmetsp:Transcript_11655/g.23864  ORF Transcript_11655/g.23864 Transcript_11655/m.23864 type:complete len:193 (+) Transcript_11655:95-673(+)